MTSARAVAKRRGSPVSAEDRGRTDGGQAGDRGDQRGELEFVEDGGHPGLGVAEPGVGVLPVRQQQLHPFQRARHGAR